MYPSNQPFKVCASPTHSETSHTLLGHGGDGFGRTRPYDSTFVRAAEGRVDYSPTTLGGLGLYFFGSLLAAFGAVKATVKT